MQQRRAVADFAKRQNRRHYPFCLALVDDLRGINEIELRHKRLEVAGSRSSHKLVNGRVDRCYHHRCHLRAVSTVPTQSAQ
jgi:hypothetical protein